MSGFLDYGVFLWGALVVASVMAAVIRGIAGEDAGAVASFFLLIGAYCAALYNFAVLQSRNGQTWGKRLVGLRAVKMVDLRPPGKLIEGLKPLFTCLEVICGAAFVAVAFSRYRQTLSDKFCDIVVLDERKAGVTLPWVVPGEPFMEVPPPEPQGAVPWPNRRGGPRPERSASATWNLGSPPRTQAPPPPDVDDLPDPEYAEESSARSAPPSTEARPEASVPDVDLPG
jgi:uncharacterized RDD family membrane protein YckC